MTREIRYDLSRRPVTPAAAIYVYDATGGTDISGGATDIPFDTEVYKDSDWFTFSATSAVITILKAGVYRVSYYVGTDVSSGSARSSSRADLYKDAGGGYAIIGGTKGLMYNRQATNGEDSCGMSILHSFSANDLIKIQAQRIAGTDTVVTVADASGLLIEAFLPT